MESLLKEEKLTLKHSIFDDKPDEIANYKLWNVDDKKDQIKIENIK
jgi:hypothetical protein